MEYLPLFQNLLIQVKSSMLSVAYLAHKPKLKALKYPLKWSETLVCHQTRPFAYYPSPGSMNSPCRSLSVTVVASGKSSWTLWEMLWNSLHSQAQLWLKRATDLSLRISSSCTSRTRAREFWVRKWPSCLQDLVKWLAQQRTIAVKALDSVSLLSSRS